MNILFNRRNCQKFVATCLAISANQKAVNNLIDIIKMYDKEIKWLREQLSKNVPAEGRSIIVMRNDLAQFKECKNKSVQTIKLFKTQIKDYQRGLNVINGHWSAGKDKANTKTFSIAG